MKKILTISVAVYNSEKYIEECLNSLIDVRYRDKIEVIVVNDGSTDDSSLIAHKYSEMYPDTFEVVDKNNEGIGSTYNIGINRANGKYILMLDADDKMNPDQMNCFINKIYDCESDIVIYGLFKNKHNKIKFDNNKDMVDKEETIETCDSSFFIHNIAINVNLLRKHNVMSDQNYVQYCDVSLIARTLIYASSIYRCSDLIYFYRIYEGQGISLSGQNKYRDSIFSMSDSAISIYKSIGDTISEEHKKRIKKYIFPRICSAYYMSIFSKDCHSRIIHYNYLVKHDKEIWSNMPIQVKAISLNNKLINFFMKYFYMAAIKISS